MKPGYLYRANKILWHEGIPYRTIIIKKVSQDQVTYTTEWPVKEFTITIKEFDNLFHKWE